MLLARSVEDRVRPRRRKSGGVLDDPSQAGANPKRGAASCSLTGSAPLLTAARRRRWGRHTRSSQEYG